tara:strand:+ start:5594 stop:6553 length:960 start_codon:yes stop_codon:yes gene_type:complete
MCISNLESENIVSHIKNYCEKNGDIFVVSLSGGVDSMVVTSILNSLKYKTVCIHINYNNRKESGQETQFLKSWCECNNIDLHVKDITHIKRSEIKRSVYEEQTRNIRFDLYKDVLKKTGGKSIILGHHDGDIVENVYNNICRGRDVLDLTVMKKESVTDGVQISRPLLGLWKEEIYKFAHKYKVPFFKDTTPLWSLRGTFRSILLPILVKKYSSIYQNLLDISRQSDEWNDLIQAQILDPFLNTIIYDKNSVSMNISDYKKYQKCFWKRVFRHVYHKYNKKVPTNKVVENLVLNKDANISFTNESKLVIKSGILVITFN